MIESPSAFWRHALPHLFIIKTIKSSRIWNMLPFKNFTTSSFLPDGNKIFYAWKDHFEVAFIANEIYAKKVYDQKEIQPDSFVLDVGAHIGIYTLKIAKKNGAKGLVVAIEPESQNFRFLAQNVVANGYSNVVLLNTALSSREGQVSLYVGISGTHTLLPRSSKKVEVQSTTLSALGKKFKNKNFDLVKIDVEGAELDVLKGGENLLRAKTVKRLVIAAYHFPTEVAELRGFLASFGYAVHVFTNMSTLRNGKICQDQYVYAEYPFSHTRIP